MQVVLDNLGRYGHGMQTTVSLTLTGYALAFALGLVIASFRVSPVLPLRAVGTLYVDVVRNVPLPVHFALFFFALPKVGIRFEPFTTSVIVVGYYHAAFLAETVRSGINTVPRGQVEAARALGLTFPGVLGRVVLPQALRSVIQPLGTIFIALTKNTSVAYTISVLELTGAADRLNNDTARPIPVYVGAAAGYLVVTLSSAFVIRQLEKRLAVRR